MGSEENFKTGDLVWARVKGYPPWPAKVTEPQSDAKRPSEKSKVYLFFFGSNNFAWISPEHIILHNDKMFEIFKTKEPGVYQNAVDALKNCLKTSSRDKSPTPILKDDVKKPQTEVVNIFNTATKEPTRKVKKFLHKKVLKKSVPERDVNLGKRDYSKYNFPKLQESLDRTEELLTGKQDYSKYKFPQLQESLDRTEELSTGKRDYSKYKFPKLQESLDRTEELLLRKIVFKRKNSNQTVELTHVEPSNKKIGFIGLGNMGQAIVRNFLKSGLKVAVWNRTQAKCDALVKLGATKVSHACDLVVECDIIFCCVSDPSASKTVIFGEHGILKGLEECEKLNRLGKGYVEMTSIDPETSNAISEAIIAKQGRYLEAPVCGTSKNAEDGSLIILASGDRKLFLDCITCFSAMGRFPKFVNCQVGYGCKMNLLLSMVYGTVNAAVAEAMALVEKLNIPHEEFIKILSHGPLQCENIIEKCKMMIEPNPPAVTPLKHIQKDINLALLMGDFYSQPMPVNAAANEVYKRGRMMKYSESDVSVVFRAAKF